MEQYELTSSSPEETWDFANRLGKKLGAGDVITLEGDLGAGKTTFTKGLANGLDVKRNVNSPTFTIIKEYMGRIPLYHMDVYRLENNLEDLGFDEYFEGDGVTVIEWAHIIKEQLPSERLEINLFHNGESKRRIHILPYGNRYINLCKEIFNK